MVVERVPRLLLIASTKNLGIISLMLNYVSYGDKSDDQIYLSKFTVFEIWLVSRSKLKEHMQYCIDHPEEISKLSKVKAQVSEVKGVMMENIEKVRDVL